MRHRRGQGLSDFETVAVLKEIREQNDRGLAITAGSAVEHALEVAIASQWPEMSNKLREDVFGDKGPLGTFYQKILIAEAIGIIDDKTVQLLNILRKIRNEFAHDMRPITMEAPQVIKYYDLLPDPDLPDKSYTLQIDLLNGNDKAKNMRTKMIFLSYNLINDLIGHLESSEQRDLAW